MNLREAECGKCGYYWRKKREINKTHRLTRRRLRVGREEKGTETIAILTSQLLCEMVSGGAWWWILSLQAAISVWWTMSFVLHAWLPQIHWDILLGNLQKYTIFKCFPRKYPKVSSITKLPTLYHKRALFIFKNAPIFFFGKSIMWFKSFSDRGLWFALWQRDTLHLTPLTYKGNSM